MATISVPFRLPGFRIAQVQAPSTTTVIITAHATARRAACPRCQQRSRRIHSYYIRAPRDVPISDRTVQLRLHVRRFRCVAPQCSQQTFAERLPEVVPVAARRTERLTSALQTLAFATGGEAGARLSHHVHMPTSPDTLLRIMRRAPQLTTPPPRVLGVDDFAFRKGCRYGTLVVDLERQRRIDLLPDRTALTLRDWLVQHPTVELLARDRSTEYARGATDGAPQAQQVADRWHLLHNLREALERLLHRRHALLARLPDASLPSAQGELGTHDVGVHTALRIPSVSERTVSAQAREQRLAQYHAVRSLHAQGRNILQIAKRLKMSRTTVRKYVQAEAFPERAAPPAPPSMLDPYRAYLHHRWLAGCENAAQLWREIHAAGYQGTQAQVEKWAYHRRAGAAPSTPHIYRAALPARRCARWPSLPSPRHLEPV
jgi:transposase